MSLLSYTELLKKSELLSADQVDARLREFESGDPSKRLRADSAEDAVAFANFLLKADAVTQWQNTHLLRGRFRGLKVGKFRVLRLIGAGGMGRVFLAEDEMLKRRVALKVLPKARSQNSRALQRFHQEARALAKLDHVNIVRVHDVDYREKTHFIVMEFVQGTDLTKRVERQGPLSELTALGYLRQTALGLQHAHESGLIHRDIKPSNLLVDENDTVKILDLGLALLQTDEEAELTADPTKTLGTVDFISPEQALHSRNLDHRTDLYSLGCTLHFLLTGRGPFSSGPIAQRLLAHQSKEPPSINDLRKALSQPVVNDETVVLAAKLMAKQPDGRPDNAGEVVALIDRAIELTQASDASQTARSGTDSAPAVDATKDTLAPTPHSTLHEVSRGTAESDHGSQISGQVTSAIQIDVRDHRFASPSDTKTKPSRSSRKRSTPSWILVFSAAAFIASLACLVFLLTRRDSTDAGKSTEARGGSVVTRASLPELPDPAKFYRIDGRNTLHRGDCRHVRDRRDALEVFDPSDSSLRPCSVCNPRG
ncbi:MAG: serine/threonine-protein kinase [Planctomycetota bacterium]